MKVKYKDFTAVVPDETDPTTILNTLKGTFSELSNGSYEIVNEGGEKTMKIFLKTGSKA